MVVTAVAWVLWSVEVSLVLHGPRSLGSLEMHGSDGCRLGLGVCRGGSFTGVAWTSVFGVLEDAW